MAVDPYRVVTDGEQSEEMGEAEKPVEGMDDDAFQARVREAIDDARDYNDTYLVPQQSLAMKYWRGDAFGNEEHGRSQFVMTEVRDKILSVMPDLLRAITSSEKIAEFEPNSEAQIDQAEQQTEVTSHVVYYDNPGFLVIYSVLMDGLRGKPGGIAKVRWAEDKTVTESEFTGLDQGQMSILQSTPDVEIIEATTRQEMGTATQVDPATGQPLPPQPSTVYDVRIRRTAPKNRLVIEAVPPEEFLSSRETRDLQSSPYLGHAALKTVSELVAMGYSREEIEEHMGEGDTFAYNDAAQTRNPALNGWDPRSNDETMKTALYVESYIRIDRDGDGIAELRKVCSLGHASHILHEEVVDEVPFAFFCPFPEPHMLVGQSFADQVMDLQLLSSNVIRTTLDSLSETVRPRAWYVEGQVNPDDMLNNEVGAPIRVRAPGMVGEFGRTFLGQQAMPVISWLDELSSRRTGVTPASQGLDPDVMQSTTAQAVQATVSSAQARSEMIVRVFAETFLKSLMRLVRNMLIKHQDRPRTMRLNGKWATVDPRVWDSDLDVHVNVALGRGTDDEKIGRLKDIASKQEQMIQLFGPVNPVADLSQVRNTYGRITNLMGFKNASAFFKPLDSATLAETLQNQNQPKPDPNMELVKVEQQKVEIQRQDMMLKDQRERIKIRNDMIVKFADIQAKYGTQLDIAQLEAEADDAMTPGTEAANGASSN